ncbi:hypothetical protein LF599_05225 [Pseudodesulfovibrio thermohalotolerans]|uniref:hypothetical protein n=1 Tax=Pseudodesulfovibrio thermohalotolerans TaxID=2880651 RepID=UPI002443437C|nr:hypothetical protein [Pseudodesulfovibrio thermohalotolerans]WFS63568.1 hypothetical protein LF599_05225 [Pseudodesulfovibrio thermohalotolerans]
MFKKKIEQNGGSTIYGWKIWIMPKIFIEAEFHAIWQSETGDYVDITPNRDGENEIYFYLTPKKFTRIDKKTT